MWLLQDRCGLLFAIINHNQIIWLSLPPGILFYSWPSEIPPRGQLPLVGHIKGYAVTPLSSTSDSVLPDVFPLRFQHSYTHLFWNRLLAETVNASFVKAFKVLLGYYFRRIVPRDARNPQPTSDKIFSRTFDPYPHEHLYVNLCSLGPSCLLLWKCKN